MVNITEEYIMIHHVLVVLWKVCERARPFSVSRRRGPLSNMQRHSLSKKVLLLLRKRGVENVQPWERGEKRKLPVGWWQGGGKDKNESKGKQR
jgi:hypothetical protein